MLVRSLLYRVNPIEPVKDVRQPLIRLSNTSVSKSMPSESFQSHLDQARQVLVRRT